MLRVVALLSWNYFLWSGQTFLNGSTWSYWNSWWIWWILLGRYFACSL